MKTIAAISACALLAFAAPAFAQNTNTSNTPGHQMQENGPRAGSPGASGYAPGQQNDTTGTGSTGGLSEGRSSTTDMDNGTSHSGTSGMTGSGQINSGSGGSSGTGMGTSGAGSTGGTSK